MNTSLVVIALALTLCAGQASAQKVYKCTDVNGTTIFSEHDCGKDAKIIDTTPANQHVSPPSSALADMSDSVALVGIDLDCGSKLRAIDSDYSIRIESVQNEIRNVRKTMGYTTNSLAGATEDEALTARLGALEGKITTLESARDMRLSATQDACRGKHDAAVTQQDVERERRAVAQHIVDVKVAEAKAAVAEAKAAVDAAAAAAYTGKPQPIPPIQH